ncbi:unnamed protein product [Lupinus luteus]|uniref:Uncharacterized protein n=1 Tax=Lupinus luteus TaxID=3873 RepID=A0AAV1YBB8_LUPLU
MDNENDYLRILRVKDGDVGGIPNHNLLGANRGIGFSICKQLASVVVTPRDEMVGLEAIEKLKQLHVTDPASIRLLEDFIRIQLDISK